MSLLGEETDEDMRFARPRNLVHPEPSGSSKGTPRTGQGHGAVKGVSKAGRKPIQIKVKPKPDEEKRGVINEAFVQEVPSQTPYGAIQAENGQGISISKRDGDNTVHLLSEPISPPPPPVKEDSRAKPQVYRIRWLMLFLFCMYSFTNAIQWIHLNIIANVIEVYYNESLPGDVYQRNMAIDMLSMIYMICYVPLIFPATWLLDRKGLRLCCLLGSFLNATGAWLKCASVAPDRFGLLMFAQTICGVAQIWILGIPTRLSAVWFGPDEVSTATSIGVFGNQVGIAVGFLIPPILVPRSANIDVMTRDFNIMFFTMAAFTTIMFFLILIFFRNEPPQPPSRAQQLAVEAAAHENYTQSLKNLIFNKDFMILTIAYGINTGSFYAISTLLNPIVLHYFPGEEQNAGRIGLTLVLLGVIGAIIGGIWLDRTKTFKSTTIVIYCFTLIGMVTFTFTLDLNLMWVVYVTAGTLGFFMAGYLPVGFEFGAELTFPESEATSSGLLNASAQLFGILFTFGCRVLQESWNTMSANVTLCTALLIGVVLTSIIRADYRRQRAGREEMNNFVGKNEIVVADPDDIR